MPQKDALALLESAQRALRDRFDDFRRALDRRDEAAYRLGVSDFHERLQDWTEAEEKTLLPALRRVEIAGRDPQREIRLEYVQLRELTRHVRLQIENRGPFGDIQSFVDNLARRFDAHESEMLRVYYPAVAPLLRADEIEALAGAAPSA